MDESSTNVRTYQTNRHWAILLGPSLVVLLGLISSGTKGYSSYVLLAFGVIWGLTSYISLNRTDVRLESDTATLFIDPGLPWLKKRELRFADIVAVDFYQPSLGSMLNFGKIIVVDKRNRKYIYRFISAPAQFVQEAHTRIMAQRESASGTKDNENP